MVLSNAERQARYRARLKEAAEKGVTPDMIRRARELLYKLHCQEEPSAPSWEEFVKASRKQNNKRRWIEMLPDDPEVTWEDYDLSAEDVELLRKVAAVGHAIKDVPTD